MTTGGQSWNSPSLSSCCGQPRLFCTNALTSHLSSWLFYFQILSLTAGMKEKTAQVFVNKFLHNKFLHNNPPLKKSLLTAPHDLCSKTRRLVNPFNSRSNSSPWWYWYFYLGTNYYFIATTEKLEDVHQHSYWQKYSVAILIGKCFFPQSKTFYVYLFEKNWKGCAIFAESWLHWCKVRCINRSFKLKNLYKTRSRLIRQG